MKTSMIGAVVALLVSGTALADSVADRVLSEAREQYHFVVQNGTFSDMCFRAGVVKAAAVQADDREEYAHFKKIEWHACEYATNAGYGDRTVRGLLDESKKSKYFEGIKQEFKDELDWSEPLPPVNGPIDPTKRCIDVKTGTRVSCD